MAGFGSTIYTVGTALNRAQDADVAVEVLVAGGWVAGHVSAMDGHGLVLTGDNDELSVLRIAAIDAVRVRQAAAFEGRPQVTAPGDGPLAGARAHPRPAAGASWS